MTTTIDTSTTKIEDRNRLFKSWLKSEIFVPGGAGGRYVPNINDHVIEWSSNAYLVYRVTDVDYTTGESTLQLMHEMPYTSAAGEINDLVLSGAPGRPAEAYRAYVDRSVKPATVSLDRRLFVLGTMARTAKIFLGTDIGVGGQVISAMYDAGGTLLGENIPLEQVASIQIPQVGVAEAIDTAVKIVATGYLSQEVVDNEVLTIVFYSDDGQIVQSQSVIVYNTSFSRQPDASRRYVTDIRLKSSFLSEGDDTHLVIPRNVTLESVLTMGEVIYSNGDVMETPVDGTKMSMHGLYSDRYIANSDGYRASLVLTYRLDPTEFVYGASVGEFKHKSKKYTVETAPFEKVFAARIWAYPEWVSATSGYRMRYFLTTLRRDKIYEITDKVRLALNSPTFEPLLYGSNQNLILTVDMNKVDPAFKVFKFVQPTTVTLLTGGNDPDSAWSVNYAPGGATRFGLGLKVKGDYHSAGLWIADITQNAGSVEDWLDKMFYTALPIFNPTSETRAPAPTHFRMRVAGGSYEYPVTAYGSGLQINGTPATGDSVVFEWILRDGTGDHLLGVTLVPFYQVD